MYYGSWQRVAACVLMGSSCLASAQLDDRWTISVNGQTAIANADGSFAIPNIAAPDAFGLGGPGSLPDFLSDDTLRVVATGVVDGVTYYAVFPPFQLPNGTVFLDPATLLFADVPPVSPIAISLTAPLSVLEVGQQTQLSLTGTLSDGSRADLTSQFSTYRSSDARRLTVNTTGVVTGVRSGIMYVTASNAGASAVRRIDVADTITQTAVDGFAVLSDGTPAPSATITALPIGGGASSDPNGHFAFDAILPGSNPAPLTLRGIAMLGGKTFAGSRSGISVLPGMITDAGILTLFPNTTGPLFPVPRFGAVNQGIKTATGDFDNDGDIDVAVLNKLSAGTVFILYNAGDGSFGPPQPFACGTLPNAIAVGDLDGDGDLDIATTNRTELSILLNNGNGSFGVAQAYAAGEFPSGLALGDLDGDGDLDVGVIGRTVSVLLNSGDGSFSSPQSFAAGIAPISIALGDLDADGDLDIAVADNSFPGTISILLNSGSGSYGVPQTFAAGNFLTDIALADLDGDNDVDVVTNSSLGTVAILLNDGDGSYGLPETVAAGSSPTSMSLRDLDGDGDQDIAVTNNLLTISILLNNGDGTFAAMQAYAVGAFPASVSLDDLDGDGDVDAAVLTGAVDGVNVALSILFNNGNGTGIVPESYAAGPFALGGSFALADLDGDDDLDIVASSFFPGAVSIQLNNGDGEYGPPQTLAAVNSASDIVVGDLDSDGDLDIAVPNGGGSLFDTVSIFLNNGNGSFAPPLSYGIGRPAGNIALGDLDGDGDTDIAISNGFGDTIAILLNNGDGSFGAGHSFASGPNATRIVLADVDDDGDLDAVVLIGDNTKSVTIMRNDGDGNFGSPQTLSGSTFPNAIGLGDLDADGDLDIGVSNFDAVSVFLNNGDGSYSAPTSYATAAAAIGIALGDLDGDGDLDLATSSGTTSGTGTVSILLNNSDGSYGAVQNYLDSNHEPKSILLGDVDGDGDLDATVLHVDGSGAAVSVLINQRLR